MEGVFEVTFGPTFRAARHFRYRMYKKLPALLGLWLEEWEDRRFYRRAIREAANPHDREMVEHEQMWEQQDLDERRAMYIADKVYWKAHRMYLELPPLTCKDDDPNWVQARYNGGGRHYLSRSAASLLREKIRAEKKAAWEPWVMWISVAVGIGGVLIAYYK